MDIDTQITKKLREKEAKNRAEHTPSGKLSASQLSKPLLEQVLKMIGVPGKPLDDYVLRLFERGNQVEDWIVNLIDADETQKFVEYNDVIGYVDAVIEGIPYEVKSVKSSQWKWLTKDGAKQNHKLQAGLYALGLGAEYYKVVYVCADDFRTQVFELPVSEVKGDIDRITTQVNKCLQRGLLPAYEPRESWQELDKGYADKYSDYPDWVSLPPKLAMEKLEKFYPDAYKKLTDYQVKAGKSGGKK